VGVLGKIGGQGYSDIKGHNPYQRQDWQDYTIGSNPWWSQSEEQQIQAKADMSHHNDLLGATHENGGVFDIGRESGYAPEYSKKRGGYSWKDSGDMNQFDIAQNMGGWNGIKDPTSLDATTTLQSGLRKLEPKKSGKGALKWLGPILTAAGFVVPALAPVAAAYNAASAIKNKNYLGAVMSVAVMNMPGGTSVGNFGTGAGGLANIGAGTSVLGNVGNSIGGLSGLGELGGAMMANAGAGALSGVSSGNALAGGLMGLSGGLGPVLGQAGVNPMLASAAGYVVPKALGYMNQEQKNKQALADYKRKMGIA